MSQRSSRCRTYEIDGSCLCISCICTALLGCFVFVIIIFIMQEVDKSPSVNEVPSIEIDSISVSNFNLSIPISAHWNINMSMHNNDPSFEFSDTAIALFHRTKEEALWMIRLNKQFDMRPENTTVHFALDFGGSADVNNATASAIRDQLTDNHGAVEFNFQFKADHPRSRYISPIKRLWHEPQVKMLVISCDVLLLFEGMDNKMQAYMLKADAPACNLASYIH